MSFDLTGIKNENATFSCNNTGWWLITQEVEKLMPSLLKKTPYWGSNDGSAVSPEDAEELSELLSTARAVGKLTIDPGYPKIFERFEEFLRDCGGFTIW